MPDLLDGLDGPRDWDMSRNAKHMGHLASFLNVRKLRNMNLSDLLLGDVLNLWYMSHNDWLFGDGDRHVRNTKSMNQANFLCLHRDSRQGTAPIGHDLLGYFSDELVLMNLRQVPYKYVESMLTGVLHEELPTRPSFLAERAA